MMRTTLATVTALMLAASAWAGEVHRWVDDQGNVHYSENPPPDAESEQMEVRTGQQMPEASPEDVEAPEEEEDADENGDTEEADEPRPDADAVAEARRRNCETAKEALETLDQHDRVQVEEEDGERRFLDPDEVDEQRANYEDLKAENCE